MDCRPIFVAILFLPGSLFAAPPESITLGKDARQDLAITVYNNDFAVVRDIREVSLPDGLVALEYRDVPTGIEPSSVMVDGQETPLDIIEQNYRFDVLDRRALLQHYIGRQIKITRTLIKDDRVETIDREGILLSMDPEIVKFGDEIEIGPEGTISLPSLPEGLTTEPALVWLIEGAGQAARSIETTYITGGVSWQADHTLMLNAGEDTLDLTTWVSLTNNSGVGYQDATLKLIAGQVNRVEDVATVGDHRESARMEMMAQAPEPEAFHEYQLYTMPRKTSIRNRETKQLHLLSASEIGYDKRYRLESTVLTGQSAGVNERRFDVRIVFSNDKNNNLGIPLPAGKVRVYERTDDGGLMLAGENRIRHTPKGEEVSIVTGQAFDLIAERSQSSFRRVGEDAMDVGYKIEVTNHKEEKVSVTVRERLYGDWAVLQQSHKGDRVDSGTLDFNLDVEPGSQETLTYLVRITR